MAENNIAIVEHAIVFQGHFRVERYGLRFRRFDGSMSRVISREVFERGHAAAVLPYDPLRDEVVLLEQFRAGALNTPGGPWCLEPVAGIIEEGERAEDVAHRESQEEAGLELQALMPICEYLASPGGSTERISLFVGRIDATKAGGVHGLADEGEDIRSLVLPFDAAWREMMGRPVAVASLLIAMQWLALNRDAIRRQWQA